MIIGAILIAVGLIPSILFFWRILTLMSKAIYEVMDEIEED